MSVGTSVPVLPIVEAQSDFALNLLRSQNALQSTILSPVSISIALAMTLLGAKEETARQIRSAIAKNATDEELHAHFASVVSLLKSEDLNVTLDAANRVYVKNGYTLLDAYVEGIKKYYGGELEQVDFTDSQNTAKKINQFVEEATRNKIHDLISPDSLNDLTRLVLINAVYFKGDWETQFKKERTVEDHDFYLNENDTKKVAMMQIQSDFAYYETSDYQVLGLPYVGNQVYMYVILPREKNGLQDLLNNLNGPTLAQLLQKKGKTKVRVKLPRFKIESKFELTPTLKTLGITDVFGDTADLSGVAGNRELKVSEVVHKAFVEVNEKGTEAAAATGVQFRLLSSIDPTPPEFHADHPFAYFLIEKDQGNVLFSGLVVDKFE